MYCTEMIYPKRNQTHGEYCRIYNYHICSEKEFLKKRKEEDSFISRVLSKPVIFLIGENENNANTRIH